MMNGHTLDALPDTAAILDFAPSAAESVEPVVGLGEQRSPLSVRETVLIIGFVASLVIQPVVFWTKLDTLTDRVVDLGSAIGSATTEFRIHAAQPGHAVSEERAAQLQKRIDQADAVVLKLLDAQQKAKP